MPTHNRPVATFCMILCTVAFATPVAAQDAPRPLADAMRTAQGKTLDTSRSDALTRHQRSADLLEAHQQHAHAARVHELIGGAYTARADVARASLRRAAELRTLLHEHKKAGENLERLAKLAPDADARIALQWEALTAYERAGDKNTIKGMLEKVTAVESDAPEHLRGLLRAYVDHTDFMLHDAPPRFTSKNPHTIVSALGDRLGVERYTFTPDTRLVTRALLSLTRLEHTRWATIQLRGSIRRQKSSLDALITGQEDLVRSYEDVFSYGDLESTLEAGYRVGTLFDHFADVLEDGDNPFQPGTHQHNVYQQQLDDIAVPLRDEAIVRYEKIASKARQEGMLTDAVRRTYARLAILKPGIYTALLDPAHAVDEGGVASASFITSDDLD